MAEKTSASLETYRTTSAERRDQLTWSAESSLSCSSARCRESVVPTPATRDMIPQTSIELAGYHFGGVSSRRTNEGKLACSRGGKEKKSQYLSRAISRVAGPTHSDQDREETPRNSVGDLLDIALGSSRVVELLVGRL